MTKYCEIPVQLAPDLHKKLLKMANQADLTLEQFTSAILVLALHQYTRKIEQ